MENLLFRKLNNLCIYLTLILVNISYCPGIILTPYYKFIITIIMGAIVLSLVLNLKRDLFLAISLYLCYGVFALLLCSIVFIFSGVFIFNVSSNIFLTITCFLLGYCCEEHSENFIRRCMKIYVLAALFLGLYSIYTNLGGFIISSQYAFAVKNSSGVLLGTAIILCTFIINQTSKKMNLILWVVVMFLLCACLLTFRCRTAIISVFFAIFYFLYKKNMLILILRNPFVLLFLCIVLFIVSILDLFPIDFIYDSLFANKNINSVDSITSGRLSTYEVGLQTFLESPFLGNALLNKQLSPVDNFVIGHLTFYGIVGAILVFPPYLYTWFICLKGMAKAASNNLYPFLCLFLLCMTSFTEGPYPFGPGTPVVCGWFLIGWFFKKNKLSKYQL